MIAVGDKVRDYEVLAHLKGGGMATLFLGRRTGAAGFARPVAIKVVHPHLSSDDTFVRMFVDEAKLSARISHPNVVHVEELGREDETYYLVMEYVHGCALNQLVRALGKLGRSLTPDLAVYVAANVAAGLHAAHETVGDDGSKIGLVHRDVSPQNVLLSYKGHVKLIDFGVAKARGRAAQTTSASLKGKIRYMAPEQAYGRFVDRRVDVYALGIILWEMLTSKRAFKNQDELALLEAVRKPRIPPPHLLNPAVPLALSTVVVKALSLNPAERPASADEFRRMLLRAVPTAREVEPSNLAELLKTVMAQVIEKQHEKLPESISVVLRNEMGLPPKGQKPGDATVARRKDLVESLTQTATGIQLTGDLDSSSKAGRLSSMPGPVAVSVAGTGMPGSGRRRGLLIGGIVAAVAALGIAVVVALSNGESADAGDVGTPPFAATGSEATDEIEEVSDDTDELQEPEAEVTPDAGVIAIAEVAPEAAEPDAGRRITARQRWRERNMSSRMQRESQMMDAPAEMMTTQPTMMTNMGFASDFDF